MMCMDGEKNDDEMSMYVYVCVYVDILMSV